MVGSARLEPTTNLPWLPYRFPRGRLVGSRRAFERRGFPTDFPVVGYYVVSGTTSRGRGFPTDFPVVGSAGRQDRDDVRSPWLPYRFPRGRLPSTAARVKAGRGFPTDFPVVGYSTSMMFFYAVPWLPYRFPRGRLVQRHSAPSVDRRGFPTDFPVVGSCRPCTITYFQPWLPYRFPRGRLRVAAAESFGLAVASLPISPW